MRDERGKNGVHVGGEDHVRTEEVRDLISPHGVRVALKDEECGAPDFAEDGIKRRLDGKRDGREIGSVHWRWTRRTMLAGGRDGRASGAWETISRM